MVERGRKLVQFISALVFNSYTEGFARGAIYRGSLKQVCLPFLNCYSCPGAIGSCPIGSLQAVASGLTFQFSFYVAGFIVLIGMLWGRLVCGWLCPFGLIQDLLYRLPSPKFLLPLWTRYFKYAILVFFVLLLPAALKDPIGLGAPYFCKWLCPAGTLEAALPLSAVNTEIRGALGILFKWRMVWLLVILALAVTVKRSFCQVLCPLGAIYSLFNQLSIFTIRYDRSLCNMCGRCVEACYQRLPAYRVPNHPECIRCLKCLHSCPNGVISWKFALGNQRKDENLAKNI